MPRQGLRMVGDAICPALTKQWLTSSHGSVEGSRTGTTTVHKMSKFCRQLGWFGWILAEDTGVESPFESRLRFVARMTSGGSSLRQHARCRIPVSVRTSFSGWVVMLASHTLDPKPSHPYESQAPPLSSQGPLPANRVV